jgi:predicted ATPase/DNA-binding SARP family transcriptional activator
MAKQATSSPPLHLPEQLTSFVGRAHDLAQVRPLLLSSRLLTLTGAGGCGKTRLAVALARQLEESGAFDHGAWFIDLTGLDNAIFIPQVIATALGLPAEGVRSLIETLVDFLHRKELLLIFDNCEHLLPGCAELAQLLLEACPRLRILATSREPLNLTSETVWVVPPLALSDDQHPATFEQLAQIEAIQLFVARAAATLPDFKLNEANASTVEQICRRLDGIPLAIELAAARVKLLDVKQIAARLDDSLQLLTRGGLGAAARHQTMRAALDWSYHLLSEREQTLFRRLAVFAGGFTLEAAEKVCSDANLQVSTTLDLLTDLVDKSLVMIAERDPDQAVRYRLLEPIRQYALEVLREADAETATRDRHLDYFLDLAEQAEPKLKSETQLLWLKRLDKEHDNLRAALAWSAQAPSHDTVGLRLTKALHYFWHRRGYWSEGRRWLKQACQHYDAHGDSQSPNGDLYLSRAIVAEGWLAYHQGDYGSTRQNLERGLALAQTLGDPITVAIALALHAQLTSYAGNTADALSLSEAGVASARRSGDRWTLAWTDYIRGMILYRQDEAAARAALDESVSLFREAGDKRSIATYLNVLGYITANAGELAAAHDLFEEALAIGHELEDKNLQIAESSNLAHLARLQGDTARAVELYEQILSQTRELGTKDAIAGALGGLGHIHIARGDLDTASRLLRESLQLGQELGNPWIMIPAVAGLGRIAAAQGQPAPAARVLGAVDVFLTAYSGRMDADTQFELEQNNAAVRAAMSPEEFAAGFASGQTLTLEQAIEEVRALKPASGRSISAPAQALDRLRLFALGPARVFLGEKALTSWSYARVKELLFYLAAHPARTKAQIGLALWLDASPAQLRNSLGTTLYHLRRVLGNPGWIIFEDDLYRFNRALDYWLDVEEFEAKLVQAGQLQAHAPQQAIELLQAAIDLYQGDFVEDYLDGEWFLLRREELRRKYLEALLNLGRLLFFQDEYARAAESYRRAIEKDDVLEEAHRELMRCYARLGERGQALRQYQTLVKLMQDELGSLPAPESAALHERLKRGEEV